MGKSKSEYLYMKCSEESVRTSGARVIGRCEPPDRGAGNQTQVLFKNNI